MAPQKALVVDDLAVNRLILGTILQKLGFEVLEAENGLQCIDVYNQERTQLVCVFMDLQMPVADGWFATRGIRELESRALGSDRLRVPVVVCTASCLDDVVDGQTVAQRAVSIGASGAVRKPLTIYAVQRILDEYAPQWRSSREHSGTSIPVATAAAATPGAASPLATAAISRSSGFSSCPAQQQNAHYCGHQRQHHPQLPAYHAVEGVSASSLVLPDDGAQPPTDIGEWSGAGPSWRSCPSAPAASIAAAMATAATPGAAMFQEHSTFGPACLWRAASSRPACSSGGACGSSSCINISSSGSGGAEASWSVRRDKREASGAGSVTTPTPRAMRRMSCDVGYLSAAAAAAGASTSSALSSSWAAATSAAGSPPPAIVAAIPRAVAVAAAAQ